jgi:hypothetical protein
MEIVERSSDDMKKYISVSNTSSQLSLRDILYEIKINGDINFIKDLCKNEEVRDVITKVSQRSRCDKSILINILKEYVLNEYMFDTSDYCEDRFVNNIKKYLGRRVRE